MAQDPIKHAYAYWCSHCRQRRISFTFTFEEWCKWWHKNLGPKWFKLRGPKKHQYVMARNGDKGIYEPSNVRCIRAIDNHRERILNGLVSRGETHGPAKLKEAQVKAIRRLSSKKTDKEIAKIYKMHHNTIWQIRTGRLWKHLPS